MEEGSVVDQLLYGGSTYECLRSVVMKSGKRKGERVTADSWSTGDAQAFKAEVRARGGIPMLAHELAEGERQAETTHECLADNGCQLGAPGVHPQVEFLWTTPDGIAKSGRLDILQVFPDGTWRIIDTKLSASCNPDWLDRQVQAMRWDVQAAAYREGAIHATCNDLIRDSGDRQQGASVLLPAEGDAPESKQRIVLPELAIDNFRGHFIVVCDKQHQPMCTWNPLSELYMQCGERRWAELCDRWERCLAADEWPAFQGRELEPPGWYVRSLFGDDDKAAGATDDLGFDDEGLEVVE
jgi:hypothetical protein